MAAIPSDSPQQLLDRFIEAGWTLVDESPINWLVAKVDEDGDQDEPFVVPKEGGRIGLDLMRHAWRRLRGEEHPTAYDIALANSARGDDAANSGDYATGDCDDDEGGDEGGDARS